MAEPDWNPDTGGRSLAEILREAGIESAARTARRRRSDDDDDTGIRQRRADAGADRAGYGRRRSDLQVPEPAPAAARGSRPAGRAADPVTAAIPGLRPERKPGVPHPSGPVPPLRRPAEAAEAAGAQRTTTRRPARGATAAGAAPRDGVASTGPIPVVRADDADLDATPRESALAWLRFAGELVIALAAGVGIYFAATVLWELIPHLAVFLAPLAVTGLVAGVNLWRERQGTEPVGARLLAVLVFAGTLLTIAPAATLLATS
ncbi:hypothetical protein SAMN04515665_11197 [Blastococcus sp. DSM 46786]|uniref:hypothetical protein n=1 Tax=Blastococcus sp. DSM 46786 TaxID=1798227 RepID=UPI0008ACD111|nr:hypothetical protein [Blastococcus sp. DSM 46786]SEL34361.1 hypothetical protein SAMN04515665_11197 [Blastococcus sp. DSM 46786]